VVLTSNGPATIVPSSSAVSRHGIRTTSYSVNIWHISL
jgi:hypothetical protein